MITASSGSPGRGMGGVSNCRNAIQWLEVSGFLSYSARTGSGQRSAAAAAASARSAPHGNHGDKLTFNQPSSSVGAL